ncbi:MAG: hypothetical protein ACI8UD_000632 [Planctomycetota bacterium]|jgi:hypothetical protein
MLAFPRHDRDTATMRFPNDTPFHMRMAALLIASLFLEHMANTRLDNWSSPQIGIVTFVMGMAWIMLFTMNHGVSLQDRIRVLEDKLERTNQLAEMLADETRKKRSLPPM